MFLMNVFSWCIYDEWFPKEWFIKLVVGNVMKVNFEPQLYFGDFKNELALKFIFPVEIVHWAFTEKIWVWNWKIPHESERWIE